MAACTLIRLTFYALLKMAKQNGVDRVFVHAFMDGRDTLPTNGAGYLEQLQQKMREYNTGKIASASMAATTLWTATGAGSALPKRSMQWSTGMAKAENMSIRCKE